MNVDDEHGRRLVDISGIPVVTVSTEGRDADWRATELTLGSDGSHFVASGPGVAIAIEVRLPGAFNAANALLAFVTLVSAGVEPDAAAAGIAGLAVVPGRMEPVSAASRSPRSSTTRTLPTPSSPCSRPCAPRVRAG